MSLDSQALLSLQSIQPAPKVSNASSMAKAAGKTPEQIKKISTDFESMFLSQMIQPMFEGIKSDGFFGGGAGEDAFKSFYIDAVSKQITKSGGIGLAPVVQKELLKLQGLQSQSNPNIASPGGDN